MGRAVGGMFDMWLGGMFGRGVWKVASKSSRKVIR